MMPACLECSAPLTPSRRGQAKRFCCKDHAVKFQNRRMTRGALLYDLFREHRRNRSKAYAMKLMTEMCRLELSWNDEDAGRKTWKPAEMALADIAAIDRPPTTNLYLREGRD